ncbi:hypothetical protein H8N03_19300 [Ramlibacter sp. USB13]|uniref:Flagellar FliJ protein n=1 Tax=Ramlibacter cellulosilyticus TaxID=2764187 RepID=A0A923MSN9_9BURK|nr:hypothetical protein [Ramlibacter cellulosilyticus]MBC5785102.1 hypothetical protein [Ramlibacter cellulosilyticus]
MRHTNAPGADVRGFAWPLSAVERQREHQVDVARTHMGVTERERQAREDELRVVRARCDEGMRHLVAAPGARLDPAVRAHVLGHVQRSLQRQRECEEQARAIEARVESARRACVEAQQRLDAARKLRESALARYLREQARREARLADLAWLVRHAVTSSRSPAAETAP